MGGGPNRYSVGLCTAHSALSFFFGELIVGSTSVDAIITHSARCGVFFAAVASCVGDRTNANARQRVDSRRSPDSVPPTNDVAGGSPPLPS
jgi:hypothetical protein